MFNFINTWYRRYFTDPQASLLVILLAFGLIIFLIMGKMLAPLLAALVIAYLLEGAVSKLQMKDITRFASVNIVYSLFLVFMAYILFGLMPLLYRQVSQFFQEVPEMIRNIQELLLLLNLHYFLSIDPYFFLVKGNLCCMENNVPLRIKIYKIIDYLKGYDKNEI